MAAGAGFKAYKRKKAGSFRLTLEYILQSWCVMLSLPSEKYAALVKRLRRLPFTEESRVRVPYVVHKKTHKDVYHFYEFFFIVPIKKQEIISYLLLPKFFIRGFCQLFIDWIYLVYYLFLFTVV
jgi:hypothetical protein